MTFQASDLKGSQFLDLLNVDFNIIKPCYTKGGPWLKLFGHLNSLCACAMRAITNHAPIGSTDLDSSQGRNLSVCVDYILSNQDGIFFMNVEDLTDIGILDGTPLTTLSCF